MDITKEKLEEVQKELNDLCERLGVDLKTTLHVTAREPKVEEPKP